MCNRSVRGVLLFGICALVLLRPGSASATNLTLTVSGRVSVELLFSEAAFSNTLSIVSPGVTITASGCNLVPAIGLTGARLLSEKTAQRGCRVDLDSDPTTDGIQGFAAGTTFEFHMCAQIDADDDCDAIWSSDSAKNGDSLDHVITTDLDPEVPGRAFQLAWEDGGGDADFNDLIAVVRVGGDEDGDGLWDDWETKGIDTNADGIIDVTLPGANPRRRNVFLEVDFMSCATAGGDCRLGDTHDHQPKPAAIAAVVGAFAAEPTMNPDGTQGTTARIDVDTALAHQTVVDLGCRGGQTFDPLKQMVAARRFAYRYMIFGHRQGNTTSSGCAEVDGNDGLVTLGEWHTACVGPGFNGVSESAPIGDDLFIGNTIYAGPDLTCDSTTGGDDEQLVEPGNKPDLDSDGDGVDDRGVGTVLEQAGTLMHELGHNLGLLHGGDEGRDFKPNYFSVLNHAFQEKGIRNVNPALPARVDYSAADLPDLNENNLDETAGVQGNAADQTRFFPPNSVKSILGPARGPIDWNQDGDSTDVGVSSDINGDGARTVLTGFNDWRAVRYPFHTSVDFEEGVHLRLQSESSDYEQLVKNDVPPVAAICPSQPFECRGPTTPVELDGTCSFDPDGPTPLRYDWTSSQCTLSVSQGPRAQASCPRGTGQFTLVVTDPEGARSPSVAASIVVVDTTPPRLQGSPASALAFSVCSDDPAPVTLALPTVSDVCSRTTLSGRIIRAGGVSLTSPQPVEVPSGRVLLRPGTFVVSWKAVDESGNAAVLEETVVVAGSSTLASCCTRPANQTITGTAGADAIVRLPSSLSFKVDARGGSDQVVLGAGDDCVLAGAGSDNFSSAGGSDVAHGGPGDDALSACIWAKGGVFEAHGNEGADNISAQECTSATLFGGPDADELTGSRGNDTLVPGSGADRVSGMAGDDTVILYDACEVAQGKSLDGGPGRDTLVTPLTVAELRARGVVVTSFETIVIKQDQRHLADCFGRP